MAKPKVHGSRRVLRWLRNIAIGVIGGVGLVLLAAFLFFQTGWGRSVLRSQIESRMNNVFVGGATIGAVRGNPLTELVLDDVVINGPDKRPAITAKHLTVKLPLLPLISHQLRVDKIVADDLDVTVEKDAQGNVNLANLTKPGPKSTWNIKLPDMWIHRGHVALVGVAKERIDLDNIELFVDAALPFAGPIDASVSLSATWRQKKAPIQVGTSVHLDNAVAAVPLLGARIADVSLSVVGLRIPKSQLVKPAAGVISLFAPARTARRLAAPFAQLDPPGAIALLVVAQPDGRVTHARVLGAYGRNRLDVNADADVEARLVHGTLSVSSREYRAAALGTFYAELGKERDGEAQVALVAANDSGLYANLDAAVVKDGTAITLERADVTVSVPDANRVARGAAGVRGQVSADLHAHGAIAPKLDIAMNGTADGERLSVADISAQAFRFRIDAAHLPARPVGSTRLEVAGLRRGEINIGKLTLAAGNRPDGKLQVSLRSEPASTRSPWLVDLDALVTTGETVIVDLQRHVVHTGGGSIWRGDSGRLAIGPTQISLHDFASTSGRGHVSADASFVRAGASKGDLTAELDAAVDLDKISRAYRGHADAHVDVSRKGGRLAGTILAKASGMSLHPHSKATFDADVRIVAGHRKLEANVGLAAKNSGGARIALDVDAPANIADARAWSRVRRDAIRTASLTVDHLQLERVADTFGAPPMKGSVDGKIALTPTVLGGTLHLQGVEVRQTKALGKLVADLKVAEVSSHELETTLTAHFEPLPAAIAARDVTQGGAARFQAQARFQVPQRLFDAAAWKQLGAGAFRGATLRAERLAFQPGTLERLGIVSDLRGELAVGAEVDPGMTAARISVNLHSLRGGLFAQPISAQMSAVIDDKSSRVVASIFGSNVTLLRVTGSIPMTLARLRADPARARTAPLAMIAKIDNVPAVAFMNVIGTSQILSGTIDGTVDVKGTIAKPTVAATLVARGVSVPPESLKRTQGVKQLAIDARWDGARAHIAIDGDETAGGTLRVRVDGDPRDLASVTASIDAHALDLAPLVAFMPGPAGGLGGLMEASFKVRGVDPAIADLAGSLHITDGRIPIAPAVGTLFKGDLKLDVKNHTADLSLAGKLGRGDVHVTAHAPLQGTTPKNGDMRVTVDKVQLIGTTQPIITGVITANLARVDRQWQANVRIDRMTVKVPKEKGSKLSPVGGPSDIVYGGEKIHHGQKHGADAPRGIVREEVGPVALKPPSQVEGPTPKRKEPPLGAGSADVKVTIRNVFVESEEVRGIVGGNLRVSIAANKETGIVGWITMTRGVIDLFNRRYLVDKANLNFDGSPDPELDVRITHDFPEVTTITEVRGRMSRPKLVMSSQPAQYTQAELLGFLLGGEPGGDPENAPSAGERVAGAGATYLGNKIAGSVKRALPIDIDVLRYETATSTSSAAVTVGTWITDTLFLAYRQHLEARPDENSGEGELEYWLQRRLVFEATAGDRGRNGADLLWRRRW